MMKIIHKGNTDLLQGDVLHEFEITEKDIFKDFFTEDDTEIDYENSKGIDGSPSFRPAYKKVRTRNIASKYVICPICDKKIEIDRNAHC
jgi:hypothetical protein